MFFTQVLHHKPYIVHDALWVMGLHFQTSVRVLCQELIRNFYCTIVFSAHHPLGKPGKYGFQSSVTVDSYKRGGSL